VKNVNSRIVYLWISFQILNTPTWPKRRCAEVYNIFYIFYLFVSVDLTSLSQFVFKNDIKFQVHTSIVKDLSIMQYIIHSHVVIRFYEKRKPNINVRLIETRHILCYNNNQGLGLELTKKSFWITQNGETGF